MNTRQKIGLGIIAPMFAYAVGHTVINKMNMNMNKADETEILPDITNALKTQDKNAATLFKTQQNILNEYRKTQISFDEYKNIIKNFQPKYPDYNSKEAQEILENSVECGD